MNGQQHTIKYFGFPFFCAIHKYVKMLMIGLTCPVCDENLNCDWNHTCFLGEVCMIRNTPFTVHCSKVSISTEAFWFQRKLFYYTTSVLQHLYLNSQKQDCIFMQTLVNEIICCEDHQCISENVPQEFIQIYKYF